MSWTIVAATGIGVSPTYHALDGSRPLSLCVRASKRRGSTRVPLHFKEVMKYGLQKGVECNASGSSRMDLEVTRGENH